MPFFGISSLYQTMGRGTRGRSWRGGEGGNVMLTMSFEASSLLPHVTLLPLQMGLLIAPTIQSLLPPSQELRLKWPNDLLIEGRKVSFPLKLLLFFSLCLIWKGGRYFNRDGQREVLRWGWYQCL